MNVPWVAPTTYLLQQSSNWLHVISLLLPPGPISFSRQGTNRTVTGGKFSHTWWAPHQGSDKTNLARFAQRMVQVFVPSKLVDTDSGLLDALQAGSEVLQEITDNFTPLMKRFRIYFFWEQEKANLGITWDYVRVFPLIPAITPYFASPRPRTKHSHVVFFCPANIVCAIGGDRELRSSNLRQR